MKTGERYYNCSRAEQIVQIMDLNKKFVTYKVQQGNHDNPIDTFKCTKERFNNIYIKIGLSTQSK
jgi:hypothetical protein